MTISDTDLSWTTLVPAATVSREFESPSSVIVGRELSAKKAAGPMRMIANDTVVDRVTLSSSAVISATSAKTPTERFAASRHFGNVKGLFHSPEYDQLAMDLRQLVSSSAAQTAQVDRLSKTVDALNSAVSEVSARLSQHSEAVPTDLELSPAAALLSAVSVISMKSSELVMLASSRGILADVFNLIVDVGADQFAEVVPAAEAQLESNDAEVRAAAARVVSYLAPQTALAKLPTLIAKESDRMTRAIMRGALDAASL